MIIVTGATGRLGSRIVTELLDRVPARNIGLSGRDPDRAAALVAQGVRVRRGDFTDPASLAHAFEDATQVLVVSAGTTGSAALAQHTAAIDAAVAAGARRILYTSHQAAAPHSLFAPMPDHAATERYLAGTGTPFVALRNGFYADTVPLLLGAALETGELVAPADGPVSWTAHADLAAAAASILVQEAGFAGATPPLTAPRSLDLADVAALLTSHTGRTVRRVVADDEEWAAGLLAQGLPAERAQLLLGMFHASRRGEFDAPDPTLEQLIGRPALSLHPTLVSAAARG